MMSNDVYVYIPIEEPQRTTSSNRGKSSGGSSFSEALSYALRRLKMTRMTVKEEQRSSMRAVYEGSDVFVWLATYWLWQEPVLPSAPFPHGLATRRDL